MQVDETTMEFNTEDSQETKTRITYDPAIPFLVIYPDNTTIGKDTCTPMFIAALYTKATKQKQGKCPWADEWIKKMQYMYMMEYYPAIKKNAITPSAATWMQLEIIILSKSERE